MNENSFDLAVIGGGPAGYVGAIRAAKLGLRTVLFERNELGGTCLNRGCIPTKTLLRSARVLAEAQLWPKLGITGETPTYAWQGMLTRKDEVVAQMRNGIAMLLKKAGVTVVKADAKVAGEGKVIAADTEYAARNILIAVGSAPLLPPIPGLDSEGVWTSDDILAGKFAKELCIIGGGVIGVEFASLMQTLGVKVTVIEALDRLVATVDREISQNLAMIFKKRGISVCLNSRVEKVERAGDRLTVTYTSAATTAAVTADAVLVAIGRRGTAAGCIADGCDIAIERGQFVVDANHHTTLPNVYAVGDVAKGDVQLAHAASAYAVEVVNRIAGASVPTPVARPMPACIFTDPEIAVTGITEAEAKSKGIEVKCAKYLMGGNGKTVVEIAERSFIKLVCEAATGRILGAQLMCPHAAEMVNEFTLAIAKGLTARDVAETIHPHPTFGEGAMEAAEAAL